MKSFTTVAALATLASAAPHYQFKRQMTSNLTMTDETATFDDLLLAGVTAPLQNRALDLELPTPYKFIAYSGFEPLIQTLITPDSGNLALTTSSDNDTVPLMSVDYPGSLVKFFKLKSLAFACTSTVKSVVDGSGNGGLLGSVTDVLLGGDGATGGVTGGLLGGSGTDSATGSVTSGVVGGITDDVPVTAQACTMTAIGYSKPSANAVATPVASSTFTFIPTSTPTVGDVTNGVGETVDGTLGNLNTRDIPVPVLVKMEQAAFGMDFQGLDYVTFGHSTTPEEDSALLIDTVKYTLYSEGVLPVEDNNTTDPVASITSSAGLPDATGALGGATGGDLGGLTGAVGGLTGGAAPLR